MTRMDAGNASGDVQRLDTVLVQRGLARSRARARLLVRNGFVQVNGVAVSRPSASVRVDAALALTRKDSPWVSRAAWKLAHALEHFDLDPCGLIALDVGASTGGFTQVLLTQGVARVYAVDCGHGQLDATLAADRRVVSLEGLNARDITPAHIPDPVDLIVCDVSFISLKKALPAALALARPGTFLVALIKPQFEVGKGRVGKGGIVRDPALHQQVQDECAHWLEGSGWQVFPSVESPVTGRNGNREFLLSALRQG